MPHPPMLPSQWLWRATILFSAIATVLIVGHAVSTLVAGSLGQTPTDRAWTYVIVLVVSLGLAGGAAELRSYLRSPWRQLAELVSSMAAGAVVGFFYAGIFTNKDPRWAITGAVLGGLGLAGITLSKLGLERLPPSPHHGILLRREQWVTVLQVVLHLSSALSAYGFFFLIGAAALTLINVGLLGAGLGLSGLAILFLWVTWNVLIKTFALLQAAIAKNMPTK